MTINSNWTTRAINEGYVRIEGDAAYFNHMPNGDYVATGHDINGRAIRRAYVVNDTRDSQSQWAMWHDFNGRWGLTSLWHVTDSGKRVLLWRA